MQNERDMHANERNMKENGCKLMQNERNMKCCRSTCLGMDLGFMLDLEHADFRKTLESDRPPQRR